MSALAAAIFASRSLTLDAWPKREWVVVLEEEAAAEAEAEGEEAETPPVFFVSALILACISAVSNARFCWPITRSSSSNLRV